MRRKSDNSHNQQLPRGLKRRKQPKKRLIVNISNTKYPIIEELCQELNLKTSRQRQTDEWDIYWSDSSVSIEFVAGMQNGQKVNHFSAMSQLSRKALLAKNLKRMQKAFPQSYAFFPLTFLLPQDIFMLNKFQDRNRIKGDKPTFIIKPQVGSQGKGIYLWQDNIDLEARKQIVQVYLQRPLLYKGLKFDLRVYILVTSCSPLRIYIFNEGLVRFATQSYQKPNSQNIQQLRMHLTNYAINRQSPKYVFNDSQDDLSKGHKKSLAQFFQTMQIMGLPAEQYWSTIKEISVKTLIAGLPWLRKQYQISKPQQQGTNACFQLLGLDFIIEENHRIFLLQVNHTPSFFTDTPLDKLVKSHLIRDSLEIVTKEQAHKSRRKLVGKRVNTMADQRDIPAEATFSRAKQMGTIPPLDDEEMHEKQLDQKYLGSFERIYPSTLPQRQQKYNSLLSYSLASIAFQTSPSKKKVLNPSSTQGIRKRMASEPKQLTPIQQFSYPPKERLKVSRIIKAEPKQSMKNHKSVSNVFDRQQFRESIQQNHRKAPLRYKRLRQDDEEYEGVKGQQIDNGVELQQIIEYHQKGETGQSPYSKIKYDSIDRQQMSEQYY